MNLRTQLGEKDMHLIPARGIKFEVNTIDILRDGLRLKLHSWIPENIKAVIFYLHGIQSHAGWLFEIGPNLAQQGMAVFVLDRRGTGLSEGLRGDMPDRDTILNDYLEALHYVKNNNQNVPLVLFGQSMGGTILAALVAWEEFNIEYDKIIFCAAALGKRHFQLEQSNTPLIVSSNTTELIDIDLCDEDYTDDINYLNFMKNDPLCFRKMTRRSIKSMFEFEKLYMQSSNITKGKHAAYIYPEIDPLVNLEKAISVFNKISGHKGLLQSFPTRKHYLWFTNQNITALNWLRDFTLS